MNRIFLVARADAAILMLVVVDMVAKPLPVGRRCLRHCGRSSNRPTASTSSAGCSSSGCATSCSPRTALDGLDWDGHADVGRLAVADSAAGLARRRAPSRPGADRDRCGRAPVELRPTSRSGQQLANADEAGGARSAVSRRSSCSRTPRATSERSFGHGVHLAGGTPVSPLVWLGRDRLGALIDAAPAVRRRVPTVLGVRDLDPLLDDAARARCVVGRGRRARPGARVRADPRLPRTRSTTLERHRFAVLTGPPEMGKTAIARTLGLALATEGWEVHECIRPEQVWDAFDPRPRRSSSSPTTRSARPSTGPTPPTAGRSTSTASCSGSTTRTGSSGRPGPAPLKAGLGRIHREHGVERFPQPARGAGRRVEPRRRGEGADPLPPRARRRAADRRAIDVVRTHGATIVEHPHFTPERIGRFVALRLPQLAVGDAGDALRAAIEAEIAEPTAAMADVARRARARAPRAARRAARPAAGPGRRARARDAARRHAAGGLPRAPAELVDRLTDHFVRVVPPTSVDLGAPELARPRDRRARRRRGGARGASSQHCSLDGLLLALSHGGGATGERDAAAARRRRRLGRGRRADPRARARARTTPTCCACSRASRPALAEPTPRTAAELLALTVDGARAPRLVLARRAAALPTPSAARAVARPGGAAARAAGGPRRAAALGARRPAGRHAAARRRGGAVPALAAARGDAERRTPEQLEELGFPDAYLAQLHAAARRPAARPTSPRRAARSARRCSEALRLVTLAPTFSPAPTSRRRSSSGSSALKSPRPSAADAEERAAARTGRSIVRRILADLG